MILKNGKRLDGIADALPIGSIIEYDGTEIPDGWEVLTEEDTTDIKQDGRMVLTITDKKYSLGSWWEIDVTKDFVELFNNKKGFVFEDNKIKVAEDADFSCIEIQYYSKLLLPWSSDPGNRGVYIYHNGTRASTDYDACPTSGSCWYSDTYRWVFAVKPGDYFTLALVRGGQTSTIEAQIEHGYIKVDSLG
jgi:hypothetical protein